jgi:hypothetical protein
VSVLRSIEHRIESLIEGAFGRAFKSHVQPVELARKLAKEMDENKSVSVSRVYVPNEYLLYLSPSDREQFSSYEESLVTELSDYLSEHARREGYALLTTPKVVLHEDEDLEVGEFGIATRMVQPRREAPSPQAPPAPSAPAPSADAPASSEAGETKIYRPAPDTAAVSAEEADRLGLAHTPPAIVLKGVEHPLDKPLLVIGRSRDCDITVEDANVSRRHAEIRIENGSYWLVDLGSTNGVELNGKRVERERLEHGDSIVVGKTQLTFERSA